MAPRKGAASGSMEEEGVFFCPFVEIKNQSHLNPGTVPDRHTQGEKDYQPDLEGHHESRRRDLCTC